MTQLLARERIAEQAIIHHAPALAEPAVADRTFELPARLYIATAGLFLGFLAVTGIGFGNPGLIMPMAICVTFLTMFFAVPLAWMRMKPADRRMLTPWAKFARDGVMTPFGRVTAGAATVQVLILPALIFAWGVAVVTIAALAR